MSSGVTNFQRMNFETKLWEAAGYIEWSSDHSANIYFGLDRVMRFCCSADYSMSISRSNVVTGSPQGASADEKEYQQVRLLLITPFALASRRPVCFEITLNIYLSIDPVDSEQMELTTSGRWPTTALI
jgi:hypothetical protein